MFVRYLSFVVAIATVFSGASAFGQDANSGDKKPTLSGEVLKNFPWRNIGPANMGGRITALAVYEKDPTIWWASSASGGLLKTENNGATFEHQFDDQATVSIGDVQVSQSDPNIVWVGTGESNPRNSSSWGDGVYKSTDGGKTWKNMGLRKIFQTGRLAIHPTNPDIVYVGALGRLWGPNEDRGLFKTTDGGKTWKKILYVDDKTGVIDVQMNQKNPDTLLVATYERKRDGFDGNDPEKKFGPGAGIYRTTDGGENFTRIESGLPSANMGRIGLNIYRKDPNYVYAVVESEKIGNVPDNFPYGGFRGENADVGAKMVSVTKNGPVDKAGVKADDIVIAIDGVILHSYNDLLKEMRSKKAGDTAEWQISRERKPQKITVTYGKRPASQRRAQPNARVNSNSPFSASLGGQRENLQAQQGENGHEYGGVYRSTDGGVNWERINSVNPRPMYYSQIRVDPSDNNNLYVLGTSLYKSNDGGKTFTSDGANSEVHVDHHSLWIDPNNGKHIILGNDGGIYVTWDRMKKWDHHNHVAIAQFYHVGIGPREDYRVYGGLQDNGSWGGPARVRDARGPMNSDWFRVGGGDGFICLVDPTDPDQIYFESQNGSMGRIHLTKGERGFIRPRPPRGTRYRFNWKTPFILSPHNSRIHYSAGNHVFRSVAKGDSLKSISPEITPTDKGAGSAISEAPTEEGVIYVGTTDGGLWMTKDGGKEWTDLFAGTQETENEKESSPAPADANRGRGGPGGAGRGNSGGAGQRGGFREALQQADKNKDGKISKEEMPERMQPFFDRMDRNSDGFITTDEMQGGRTRGRGGNRSGNRPPGDRPSGQGRPSRPPGADPDSVEETAAQEFDAELSDEFSCGGDVQQEAPAPSVPQDMADEKSDSEKKATAQENAAQAQKTADAKDAEKKAEKSSESKQAPADKPKSSKDKPAAKSDNAKADDDKSTGDKPADDKSTDDKSAQDLLSGTWKGEFIRDGIPSGQSTFTVILRRKPDGKTYSGSFESTRSQGDIENGKFDAKKKVATFSASTSRSDIDFTADVTDGEMRGNLEVNGGSFTMEFEAKRTGDAPAASDSKKKADEPEPGEKISELLPGRRWVSSLHASKFKKGRCYVTFDGHRSNDDEPYVFVTENYGKSWTSIRANLPVSAGSTRVIREDITSENILYLGCEFSFWVSIDRGASWTKFNEAGFPTVAVHEIAQHPSNGDIVAGTHGRSLWIMNATALRQMTKDRLAEKAYLFKPAKVTRWRSLATRGSSGTRQFVGTNPDRGSAIYYSLGTNARAVELEISSLTGTTIFTAEEPATRKGLHRIDWNLSSGSRSGRGRGRRTAASGQYLITLTVDGEVLKQTISVVSDPDYSEQITSDAEVEFLEALYGENEEDESGDRGFDF